MFFFDAGEETIQTIANMDLDIFVDNLESVFSHSTFPTITRVLFSEMASGSHHDLWCGSSEDIGDAILGG